MPSYHPPAQTPISPGSIFLTLGLDKSRIVHELPGPGSGSGGVGSCSSFLELGDALGTVPQSLGLAAARRHERKS